VSSSQLHTNSKTEVGQEQSNGEIQVDKIVHSSEQGLAVGVEQSIERI
jgi:hypothetical protein